MPLRRLLLLPGVSVCVCVCLFVCADDVGHHQKHENQKTGANTPIPSAFVHHLKTRCGTPEPEDSNPHSKTRRRESNTHHPNTRSTLVTIPIDPLPSPTRPGLDTVLDVAYCRPLCVYVCVPCACLL